MKRIGIAVVEREERVLVGVRPAETVLAGMDEFPGGKCRDGEAPAACAIRECLEETGLRVDVIELLMHRQHAYAHGALDLSFFLCRPVDADGEPAVPFRWVPIRELLTLKFPEANREVIQMLVDRSSA